MKEVYDRVCSQCAVNTTRSYSTSFSLGIFLLSKEIRGHIYAIYGLVRFADEIVDTFLDHDKRLLLDRFKEDCFRAISEGISLNPILHSFQQTVRRFEIPLNLIEKFFHSMEMDLSEKTHDQRSLDEYIVGSAEVVGLMCLHVFVGGDKKRYEELKYPAERLGAAFQKVNFLRDLRHDEMELGRTYFPEIQNGWNPHTKRSIEANIEEDFNEALKGIRELPESSRLGVFVAYSYYRKLFDKISRKSPEAVRAGRIRVSNFRKMVVFMRSYAAFNLQMIR